MTLSETAKILNVSESATPEQVYKVYKQLAKKNIIPILITSRLRQNKHTINHALTFNAHVLTGIWRFLLLYPNESQLLNRKYFYKIYTPTPRLRATLLRLCYSPCVARHTKRPRGEVWLESVSDFRTKDILDLLTVGKNINNCL